MQGRKIILITGGIRSGKSQYALATARTMKGKKIFLATAEAFDAHMTQRINRHKKDRGGAFQTVEEPFHLGKKIKELKPLADVIVVDCLTVWMNNLLYGRGRNAVDINKQQDLLISALKHCASTVIMVTNEVGAGIISDNPLVREFSDRLGGLNQEVAGLSDEVILMVCGIPQCIKNGKSILNM